MTVKLFVVTGGTPSAAVVMRIIFVPTAGRVSVQLNPPLEMEWVRKPPTLVTRPPVGEPVFQTLLVVQRAPAFV